MLTLKKRVSTRSRDTRGFTLVELLVALTVLSIGLLAVATLLLSAITMNSLGKSTNEALAQARDKVEILKTLDPGSSQRDIGGSVTSDVTGYSDTVGQFHRRWEITAGPTSNTKSYTIVVIPLNQDPRTAKTVTLTTIF